MTNFRKTVILNFKTKILYRKILKAKKKPKFIKANFNICPALRRCMKQERQRRDGHKKHEICG